MFSYAWERMLQEMEATLNIYPEVKGIQVLNDMGNYLFSRYRGEWIPDTPARRSLILQNLRNWNVFSNSSPVEGITNAVRTFTIRVKKSPSTFSAMNSPAHRFRKLCKPWIALTLRRRAEIAACASTQWASRTFYQASRASGDGRPVCYTDARTDPKEWG